MYQRARYKLDIDDKVIQAGRFDNKSTQEEQEEFLVSIDCPPIYGPRLLPISAPSSKPIKKKRTRRQAT
jgi:hypothetical protein